MPASPPSRAYRAPPASAAARTPAGTPITITGAGFEAVRRSIVFADDATPFSVGTQYAYTVNSDTSISTQTVEQNPAAVDVEVCTVTGCSYNPPADIFLLYPPGKPESDVHLTEVRAGGRRGTAVTIRGRSEPGLRHRRLLRLVVARQRSPTPRLSSTAARPVSWT